MAIQAAHELKSEYRVLREGVGLLDRSGRAQLEVLGPDALDYLQGQVTNDVEALSPGNGCYAALLNPKGRLLADMRVLLRSPNELWLDAEAEVHDSLFAKLDMYRIGRRVELIDCTDKRAVLSLIGPAARRALAVDAPVIEHASIELEMDDIRGLLVTTDVGFDLIVSADERAIAAAMLSERGAVAVSEEAAEIVRVESGRPRYGKDMTDANLPAEVGLEQRAVSFTKGCYVGQEPVARMHYRGHPNRHLRGLELSAPVAPREVVVRGGKEVGRVTSSCVSPALGPIALAIVRREVEPGQEVMVGTGEARGVVLELPFGRA